MGRGLPGTHLVFWQVGKSVSSGRGRSRSPAVACTSGDLHALGQGAHLSEKRDVCYQELFQISREGGTDLGSVALAKSFKAIQSHGRQHLK